MEGGQTHLLAELVVLLPLVLVAEHLVGLVDLLELLGRLGVVRVLVRVVLLRQLETCQRPNFNSGA